MGARLAPYTDMLWVYWASPERENKKDNRIVSRKRDLFLSMGLHGLVSFVTGTNGKVTPGNQSFPSTKRLVSTKRIVFQRLEYLLQTICLYFIHGFQ